MKRSSIFLLAAFAVSSLRLAAQGSLTPPGPPAPIMKTLDQIEARTPISSVPFVISNAGSFYLTTNFTFVGAGNGITVNASDVTIDLNGFTLAGNNSTQTNGIYSVGTTYNLTVRNGTLRGWKNGVNATNNYCALLSDLRLQQCALSGVTAGNGCIVTHCTAASMTGCAFKVGNSSVVRDSSANGCSGGGINASIGCTIVNCSLVQNNVAIQTLSGCMIKDCAIYNNNGVAVSTTGNCRISGCSIGSNFDIGVSTSYSTVEGCTISGNSGDGILAALHTDILNNTLYNNGGFTGNNIHVTGNYCRVEGNHVTYAGRGIKIDSAPNVIVRNSAGINTTNYAIAASNMTGPLVSSSGVGTNSNPNANLDF